MAYHKPRPIFKRQSKNSWLENEKEYYGLQTPTGEIVAKFRNRRTATNQIPDLEKIYLCELKVVELK